MKSTFIIAKNELLRYFTSPLAYVYLVAFLILNGSFAIYFGHFFERGRAELVSMFAFQPWLYLLFIPGISMRLWAEEFRSKSIVQIMTMPVSAMALVWGKFLASWIFCAIALALTFPFWITVNILGNPDNSVIMLSYAGSLLLAGCMLSISQTMSALTKNQVIALVLAVVANLLFLLSSLEYVLGLFRLFLPLSIVDLIASFSFITHFDTISRGLLEMRDLIFYFSIILLFNFTTEIIISFKTSGTSRLLRSGNRRHYITVFIFLLLGFIGLNLLANNYLRHFQHDFSEEKTFTLTPATRSILKNLPHPVTAKLYYSKALGERNPEFRLFFDKIRLLLQQYVTLSDGKFSYHINYVEPLDSNEDYAIAKGLHAFPLIDVSQSAFFGMILNDSIDNTQIIPFFPLERQDFIEQDLTEAVYTINNEKKPLGIISSLPLGSQSINNILTQQWEIVNRLNKFYDLKFITRPEEITFDLSALMIVHPQGLTDELADKIKDYSYKGGKILLFVDIAAEAMNNIAPVTSLLTPSDLHGLDKAWEIRFHPEAAVVDLDNSVMVNASGTSENRTNFTQDVVQFLLKENNFNPRFPETALLKKMLFSSATLIEPVENSKVIFEPLVSLSPNSAIISADPIRRQINPADLLRSFKKDKYRKFIAARISSSDMSKPFDLVVVGDSDMLYDTYWGKTINLGKEQYFIPMLDNANFVLNSLEVLTKNQKLISLRGHSGKIRSFDSVEKIRKDRAREAKIKENEILDHIDTAKKDLQEVWAKKTFEQRINFTPDELAVIANIRKNLDRLRQELQKVQKHATNDIERIDFLIKFSNIYAIPLLLILVLGFLRLYRYRRNPRAKTSSAPMPRRVWLLISFSAAILVAGLVSTHYNRLNDTEKLLQEPVFPTLPQQINNVQRLVLSGSKTKLEFYKENGLWNLEGEPRMLVLQDRIRSFLSALLEARYFEKKSDQVQYLPRFGLEPFENPQSRKIQVQIQNSNHRDIENFEVGNYDIDIGRGSRAAYVKFPDSFQVWMIAADFIDLSLNSSDWTYGQLWNLRLGRLLQFNDVNDPMRISLLVGRLLNTNILSSAAALKDSKLLFEIRLYVGSDQIINLQFWQEGNKYYASYDFRFIPNENNLQLFAKYTKQNYYEISRTNMEIIKNAAGIK